MQIGILKTGHAPPALAESHGEYPAMFERLLAGRGLSFRTWSVIDSEFPTGPLEMDGWLITGSRHGAYEDHDWIAPLERLIRDIYAAEIPLVGICFGHQIIAQALGGRVEKFAGGWVVGRTEYDFGGETVALNAWHQDQVVERPEGARQCAVSPYCENAALIYGTRAYTIQAHPEFESDFVADLAEARGRGTVPDDLIEAALAQTDRPIDNAGIADRIARFFHDAPRTGAPA